MHVGAIVHRMTSLRYDRRPSGLPRPLPDEVVEQPSWLQVQAAIRKMDNFCFPIVHLACTDSERDGLSVVGGPRRFAVSRIDGSWTYENPAGGNKEVILWSSDQGYYCSAKNIIYSKRKVLQIAWMYFQTGDFTNFAEVDSRS